MLKRKNQKSQQLEAPNEDITLAMGNMITAWTTDTGKVRFS